MTEGVQGLREEIAEAKREHARVMAICMSYAPESGTTYANSEAGLRHIELLKGQLLFAMLQETVDHWQESGNEDFMKCAGVIRRIMEEAKEIERD